MYVDVCVYFLSLFFNQGLSALVAFGHNTKYEETSRWYHVRSNNRFIIFFVVDSQLLTAGMNVGIV